MDGADRGGAEGRRPRLRRPRRPRRSRPADRFSASDSSSRSDDEPSMGSDDCCIYTYRGGDRGIGGLVDAAEAGPSTGPGIEKTRKRSGASSPDMDYLEMDFDPGPTGGGDSDREDRDEQIRESEELRKPLREQPRDSFQESPDEDDAPGPSNASNAPNLSIAPITIDSNSKTPTIATDAIEPINSLMPSRPNIDSPLVPHVTVAGQIVLVRRTVFGWPAREAQGHRSGSGDLISPGEIAEDRVPDAFSQSDIDGDITRRDEIVEANRVNLSSAFFHCTMAKKLIVDNYASKSLQKNDLSKEDEDLYELREPLIVPKCMIWTEQEACSKQVTQISTSACGATAVINTLSALGQNINMELITTSVNTRLRANNASLCKYIISRAIAGCGVEALSAGLQTGSGGTVFSRHFSMWPERALSLSHWLAYWIELGAVPIATLNLQANILDPERIPDSWHHQMIFGVGPRGIYLTNPVECVEESALWHQLCSDSILFIKRKDILSRWTRETDLSPLKTVPGDERWKTMNVLGQVVNMIRESQQTISDFMHTTHIKIPACYSAGVTVATLIGSPAYEKLLLAPELPILH